MEMSAGAERIRELSRRCDALLKVGNVAEPELTRRDVLARLGAGALFVYTAVRVDGDEEKNGGQKQVC
jgi:hypothetical protein